MIRQAAVAGAFYPADPVALQTEVDALLRAARAAERELGAPESALGPVPAIIVPHAGYIYSGATAALAYQRLAQRDNSNLRKIVLVGPTHRVAVRGVAYPAADAFATPLGALPLWPHTKQALAEFSFAHQHNATHQDEHAIEVQLPFLQRIFGNEIPIVPLNAGSATGEQVADVLEALIAPEPGSGSQGASLAKEQAAPPAARAGRGSATGRPDSAPGGPETLIVISSDLSHYLPYELANALDAQTIGQILTLTGPISHEQACGATPVNGIIELARRRGWVPRLLGACNSGDGVGDRQRVVGYCAVEFDQEDSDVS